VAGCDLSQSGIAQARAAWPTCRFEVASAYDDLQQRFESTFDAVISAEVIEHLYDPRLFVRRAYGVLDPGGLLVLTTPYHGYLKNLALAVTGRMEAHFTALWDGGHIKFWSPRTLAHLLAETGFVNVAWRGVGRLPLLWKSMVVLARRP
jgi:2-polyprenyl-3-methyl-5-hydroxy-6-metoxy-1,4-benzoquinol methylase